MSTYFGVADPEYNLGRVLEGGEGEGTGGVSPAVGWGSGASPEKILKKMKQLNGAIWSKNQAVYTRSISASSLVILHQKYTFIGSG